MRKIAVSSTLPVYHDGQFWVRMFECIENGKLRACRIVFGNEPSSEEIQELVIQRYRCLHFTEPVANKATPRVVANPKRKQREAARETKRIGPSTKAQIALSAEREATTQQRKTDSRERREQEKQRRFEMCQEKRRRNDAGSKNHRGWLQNLAPTNCK